MENNQELMEIENVTQTQVAPSFLPMGDEAKMISYWAKQVSASPHYKSAGGEAAIISMWLTAKELNLPVMGALNGLLYFVQGKVCLSAAAMQLLIRKAGHSIQKVIGDDKICTLRGKRRDTGDTAEFTFTMQMAERAGLLKNAVWKSYPERMIFNRCLSNLAKDLFADCIGAAYIEDEIEPVTVEVVPDEPLDTETLAFIDSQNLMDLTSTSSAFIDSIAINTGDTRKEVIRKCSKDQDRFKAGLKKFMDRKKPVEEKKA